MNRRQKRNRARKARAAANRPSLPAKADQFRQKPSCFRFSSGSPTPPTAKFQLDGYADITNPPAWAIAPDGGSHHIRRYQEVKSQRFEL